MSPRDALKMAQALDLDLVKVAPQAKPPVCKILDYGKYRFEMQKKEKEAKEKRLEVYTEKIQEKVLSRSSETIRQLVEERHRQKMTQQEIADITGIKPSNMARFESGGRVPTLVVLEKYANALGKHIEIKICDD